MNSEQRRVEEVLQYFLKNHCDDPQNGTKFDCAVIDSIRELQARFADDPAEGYIITDEMKQLGFILKNGNEGKLICGCSTIPCFGGKMPYQNEPEVPCAIGQTMCDESPIQILRIVQRQRLQLMREQI